MHDCREDEKQWMPKVEDGEKVNRSSKGRVKKEGGGKGVGVMRARGLRCFRGSRVARNLHFNLLSFRFHHYPPLARTRWNPRAFERLANTPHREKASVAVRTEVCASVYVCMYTTIGAVKTPR